MWPMRLDIQSISYLTLLSCIVRKTGPILPLLIADKTQVNSKSFQILYKLNCGFLLRLIQLSVQCYYSIGNATEASKIRNHIIV